MSIRSRLALVVVLQTLALFAMVAMKQWTLATGMPVLLETEPIDPRSLFRGDYVRLGYAIGSLQRETFPEFGAFGLHDTVYVVLQEAEPYWQPVSLHRERPEVQAGEVAIKGEVTRVGDVYDVEAEEFRPGIALRFGIENYFVPEGEGWALERPAEGEEVAILVAVDRYGNAGIKAVLVNGEIRYEERLF